MKARKIIEAMIVIAVAATLFIPARIAGIAQHGAALWGGEIGVPLLVLFGWYAGKSIVKDVKYFKERGLNDES